MREIPIVPKPARVFRTGTIGRIVERTLERMREVYGAVGGLEVCRDCGAPRVTSRTTGKLYCIARCFAARVTPSPEVRT